MPEVVAREITPTDYRAAAITGSAGAQQADEYVSHLPAHSGAYPLGNLRNSRATAASCALDRAPGLIGLEHAGNPVIALRIFRTALVAALSLRPGLTLSLPAAAIVVIFAGHSREDVEQHSVVASNIRLVTSSACLMPIMQLVG